jgi:hypothetical protein
MSEKGPWLAKVYRIALVLYPARFRDEYQRQMLQTLGDAFRDRQTRSSQFWFGMFYDLLKSAATERMLMLREQVLKRPIFFHAFALAAILTMLGAGAALTMQQMLRRGANQPQAEMADFYSSEILSGMSPQDAIPRASVDLERNLQPFVIFYDERGQPVRSTGYLDQSVPVPPRGVFDYARSYGSDTITWQPRRGVRIAAVARHVAGIHPGYVLAGRSLRLTEEYEGLLRRMVFGGWFAVMLLITTGAVLLNRAQHSKSLAA